MCCLAGNNLNDTGTGLAIAKDHHAACRQHYGMAQEKCTLHSLPIMGSNLYDFILVNIHLL